MDFGCGKPEHANAPNILEELLHYWFSMLSHSDTLLLWHQGAFISLCKWFVKPKRFWFLLPDLWIHCLRNIASCSHKLRLHCKSVQSWVVCSFYQRTFNSTLSFSQSTKLSFFIKSLVSPAKPFRMSQTSGTVHGVSLVLWSQCSQPCTAVTVQSQCTAITVQSQCTAVTVGEEIHSPHRWRWVKLI